ncbi:MAG: hypothetical protein NTW51_09855 [Cyanobacteria bacterium]|nr:hypothetical protein [Cyanobacteriota bacterium]
MTLTPSLGIMPQKRQQRQCSLDRGAACTGAASAVAAAEAAVGRTGKWLDLAATPLSCAADQHISGQVKVVHQLADHGQRLLPITPFRFHTRSRLIVLGWVNDTDSKHAYESKIAMAPIPAARGSSPGGPWIPGRPKIRSWS